MYKEFTKYGKILFEQKLVNLHSGNISIREGEEIYITRKHAQLGDITFKDIVKVKMDSSTSNKDASSETNVHRLIYIACQDAHAVVHAHTPFATALTYKNDVIKPIDIEGKYYLPEIPVVCPKDENDTGFIERELPVLVHKHKAVLVRGHGVFSVGPNLEEAVGLISTLESSCQIIYLSTTGLSKKD